MRTNKMKRERMSLIQETHRLPKLSSIPSMRILQLMNAVDHAQNVLVSFRTLHVRPIKRI